MNRDNKSLQTSNKKNMDIVNTPLYLNVFHSIRLKEFNQIYCTSFSRACSARMGFVILNHLSSYQRNILNDFYRLYNFKPQTSAVILKDFVRLGLVMAVGSKRKTNLGVYVPLTAYQITSLGKSTLVTINELIELKIKNLN